MRSHYDCEKLNEELFDNENVYLISSSYRSCYHDDYASFTYWDAEKQKITESNWTTAAYCPPYRCYEKPSVWEAVKKGIVDPEPLRKAFVEDMDFSLWTRRYRSDIVEDLFYLCPCTVSTGRKFRGTGTLIKFFTRKASIGYGRSTSYRVAEILTSEGEVVEATEVNVEFDKPALDGAEETLKDIFMNMDVNEFLNKRENGRLDIDSLIVQHFLPSEDNDALKAYNAFKEKKEQEKKEKHQSWVVKKQESLMEWCRDKFVGKTEEELRMICRNIMIKKYGECVA